MIGRGVALVLLVWALGFVWFAAAPPQPAAPSRTDAIVVPTGSGGRIQRGLDLLNQGYAPQLLVSGVDPQVRPGEFQAEYGVPDRVMNCCVTLGFSALDTRGNAQETARWVMEQEHSSIRLVTADWHMRRAALELSAQMPGTVAITRDAVRSRVSLSTLFREYHKYLAVRAMQLLG